VSLEEIVFFARPGCGVDWWMVVERGPPWLPGVLGLLSTTFRLLEWAPPLEIVFRPGRPTLPKRICWFAK